MIAYLITLTSKNISEQSSMVKVQQYIKERIVKLRYGGLESSAEPRWPVKLIAYALNLKFSTVQNVLCRFRSQGPRMLSDNR